MRTLNPSDPRGWLGCGILTLLVLAMCGYALYGWWTRTDVELHVDNATDLGAEVSINGRSIGMVEAGTHRAFRLVSGKRHIVVKQGEIVFDDTKDLKPGTPEKPTRYLVNVKGAGRYRAYEAKYGADMGIKWPKSNFPAFAPIDVKARAQEDFRRLLEAVKLVPRAEWMELAQFDHVLEHEPDKVQGFLMASRQVLARVDRADHEAIEQAKKHKDPTPEDAQNLHRIITRVLEQKPSKK